MASILIVEPNRITAGLLSGLYSGNGRPDEVATAVTRDEVREIARTRRLDLALLRYGPDLRELVELLDRDDRPRIVVTGFDPVLNARERIPDGVDEVLTASRIGAHSRSARSRARPLP